MIVHIVSATYIVSSGPSYSVLSLSKELRKLGKESVVLSIGKNRRKVDENNIQFTPFFGIRKCHISLGLLWFIYKNRGKIDVIHNNGMWLFTAIFPNILASVLRIPIVHAPRGTLSNQALMISPLKKRIVWHLVQRHALQKVSYFHATSDKEADEILKSFPRADVCVLPIGINLTSSRLRDDRRKEVVFIGRIHPIKNLEMIIEAWLSLGVKTKEWTLKIYGPGSSDYVDSLKSRVSNTKNISFLGEIEGTANKAKVLQCAKWSILFSKSENFGVSILESLALGTPVIASTGTPWEKISVHKAGFHIDCTVESLAEKFNEVFRMPENEYTLFVENALNLAARDYSWPNVAKQSLKMYEELYV